MKSIVKESMKVATPLLFSLLLQNLINITDTIFLGRVGEVELGASALAGVYYMALYYTGFGFGMGMQALVARRNGEKNFRQIGVILWQSMLFLSVTAVATVLLTYLFAPMGFSFAVSSEAVYGATMDYLDWRIWGIFPAFLMIIYRSFFVGIKDTKVLIYSSLAMTASNVILNYLFIFGVGEIEPMGIRGAALASVISEGVGLLFYLVYCKMIDTSRFALFSRFDLDIAVIRRILNVSLWTMMQYFLTVFVWLLFFIAIEQLGERALAVSNLIRSLGMLLFVVISAFATSGSSLAGNALGERSPKRVVNITKVNVLLCYAIMVPIVVVIGLLPEATLSIFTDNSELIAESVSSVYIMLLYMLLAVASNIIFNIILGTGNSKSSLWIEMAGVAAYGVMIWLIVLYQPAVWVCWSAELVYWGVILLLGVIYMYKAKWWNRAI